MSTFKNTSMSTLKDDPVVVLLACALFIAVFFLGSMMGFNAGISLKEKEAIRMNAAEWVADKDGRPQFKWKEAKP